MIRTLKNTINAGDIVVNDGIGERNPTVIDCTGCFAWPGLIDSHVHFRTPGEEEKEDWMTGSQAALAGGITSVVDMPNNRPPITTVELWRHKKAIIAPHARVQYQLAIGATDSNIDQLANLPDEIRAVKVYMTASSSNLSLTGDEALEQLFATCPKLLMIHAEDNAHPHIHGRESAIAATQKVLTLAQRYQRAVYLCHVSTAEEISLIEEARRNGCKVYVEVTPHHLFLNEIHIKKIGGRANVNPPLRTEADNIVLFEAIRRGIVDAIASDHAPHMRREKELPYDKAPAGMPNIELLFPLLLTAVAEKRITLDDIYRCCISNPANIFGFQKFPPEEQTSVRDIVIFDPNKEWTVDEQKLNTKVHWSPFHGWKLRGHIKTALVYYRPHTIK